MSEEYEGSPDVPIRCCRDHSGAPCECGCSCDICQDAYYGKESDQEDEEVAA